MNNCQYFSLKYEVKGVKLYSMNRLSKEKRAKIIKLIVEGVSVRSISRLEDVHIATVLKLLLDAGEACKKFHDTTVRNVKIEHSVECDELWSFVHCKDAAIEKDELIAPPEVHGSVWTWTSICSTSKLMLSCYISKERSEEAAITLFKDVKKRIVTQDSRPVTIYCDRLPAYTTAGQKVFKNTARVIQERKGRDRANNTSYVERSNLTVRMCNRRYTRKTNAHSKLMRNHRAAMHVFQTFYNFCRLHTTLQISPAMAAKVVNTLYDETFIINLVDQDMKVWKHGPAKGTTYKKRA